MAQYLRSLTTKLPSAAYVGSGPALLPKPLELGQLGAVSTRHFNPAFRAASLTPLKIHQQDNRRRNISPSLLRAQSLSVLQSSTWEQYDPILHATNPLPLEEEELDRSKEPSRKSPLEGKPSPEQLQKVHDVLVETLPHVFTKPLDYRIISPNVILVDNIRGKTYKGLLSYVQQVALLRFAGHFKYAFVRLDLLNSSIDPLEGRVIIRWRIKGISGLRVFLKFWSYKLWKWREIVNQQEIWHDGISYYDVSAEDGLVYKHTIDKVEEDKDHALEDSALKKLRLASKLAGASSAFVSPIILGAMDKLSLM